MYIKYFTKKRKKKHCGSQNKTFCAKKFFMFLEKYVLNQNDLAIVAYKAMKKFKCFKGHLEWKRYSFPKENMYIQHLQ